MSVIDEEALIQLVQKYPLLYDLTSPLYIDQQKKEEAWTEISILMSATAYDCKTKWTRLRENYRKALITRKKNPGGRMKDRAVKNETLLSFLNEKFTFTPRKRNILPLATDYQESEEPSIKILAVESTSQITKPNKDPEKEVSANTVHELNAFFEGIAETVKTFPKKVQVQLKREVFNLVNDTEASLVEGNSTVVYYSTDSSMLAMPDSGENRVTDSPIPQTHASSGAMNLLQNINSNCDVQIKEENV